MITTILAAALVPALLACILLALTRNRLSDSFSAMLPPLGYAAAYLIMFSALPWPIREARHWLFWEGWIFGIAAAAASCVFHPGFRHHLAAAAFLTGGLLLQFLSLYRHSWGPAEACVWTAGMAVVLYVVLAGWLRLADALSPRLLALLSTGIFSLASLLLAVSGTVSDAQLAGGVASALGGLFFFSLLRPFPVFPSALVWLCVFFLMSFLAQGYFYARAASWPLALALLAIPAAARLASRWEGKKSALAAFAAAWGLLAGAVALALSLSEPLEY